jgi:hypothetical protein
LIKRRDYDPHLFDAIDQSASSGADTPSNTPVTGLRAFVDLVTTIGGILERLHGENHANGSNTVSSNVDLVLRLEKDLEDLRMRIGSKTFGSIGEVSDHGSQRTARAGALLREIHFHW